MTLRHWSRVTPYTSPCGFAECCVFAKQSPGPLCYGPPAHGAASAPHPGGRPFSRSYGASLPSSLTWFLPSTLVCSTCPPVSVCGTGRVRRRAPALFSAAWPGPLPPRRTGGTPSRLGPKPCALGPADPVAGGPCLPRRAESTGRGSRNIGLEAIGYALPPRLRTRLTLGGRTWPRKPWTFGGADSRRPFRYSCLHGRSPAVHPAFRRGFGPRATLSYQGASLRPPRIRLRPSVPIIFGAEPLVQ